MKVEGGKMSKLYIVKQRDLKDCGVACLLSIIKYYGGNVPLEQLRIDTYTNLQGTTAFNLVQTAQKYGFDSAGYKVDINMILSGECQFPFIAHINNNGLEHFIVVYGLEKNKLIVMDPAIGKRIINKKEFEQLFDGIIVKVNLKNKVVNIKNNYSLVSLFLNIIKKEKTLFLYIFISNFLVILFTVFSSYYFKLGYENLDKLKFLGLIFLIIVILKCMFSYIRDYLENYLNKNLDVYLNKDFLNHLFNLPSKIIESRTVGEIITRVNELNNVKGLFSELFVSFFLNFILSLVIIPILIYINSRLCLILVLSMIIYFLIGFYSAKTLYKRIMHNIDIETKFNTILVENISGFRSVKNLNVTDKILLKIENICSKYIFDKFSFSKTINKIENSKNFVNELSLFLVNFWGFYFILKNNLNFTDLIIFNSLMSFFLDPIKNLINSLPKYYFLKASFTKINEFLSIEEEKRQNEVKLDKFQILFKDVTFNYSNYKSVLCRFNLIINEKEKVLLTGKSGVGKSTICKLISKLEDSYKGYIYIGDNEIKSLNPNIIRNYIVYVSQHERLYSDTIKNNILFYRNIDSNLFNKITKACCVDQIVDKKSLGYESFIDMDCTNFSGGETQRIVLARACLNKFQILILDEALSECDKDLENKIISNLKRIFSDKTIIYVSHKNPYQLFERVINIGD